MTSIVNGNSAEDLSRATAKVFATIVTFNRLMLLKRCIQAIRAQSRLPDRILVINNNSTDGTSDWLKGQSDITHINQENSGSAGGQYTAFRVSYDSGAEWLWTMDDDGLPGEKCLETLLKCSNGIVVSPVPRVIDARNDLAFKTQIDGEQISSYERLNEVACGFETIVGKLFPFNGLLIPRGVIKTIGYPNYSMFIWGDEMEWYLRCRRGGIEVAVVVGAEYYHPRERIESLSGCILGRPISVLWSSDRDRLRILLRNQGWNWRMELGSIYLALRRGIAVSLMISRKTALRKGVFCFLNIVQGSCGIVGRGQFSPSKKLLLPAKESSD